MDRFFLSSAQSHNVAWGERHAVRTFKLTQSSRKLFYTSSLFSHFNRHKLHQSEYIPAETQHCTRFLERIYSLLPPGTGSRKNKACAIDGFQN